MAKVQKRKCPKWLLRALYFVGRVILLVCDYLDDREINGSSLQLFENLQKMFSIPVDDDSKTETT